MTGDLQVSKSVCVCERERGRERDGEGDDDAYNPHVQSHKAK